MSAGNEEGLHIHTPEGEEEEKVEDEEDVDEEN